MSTSETSRFATGMFSSRENLAALMNLSGAWIDSVQARSPLDKLVLDMHSAESETYGQRPRKTADEDGKRFPIRARRK